MFSSDLAVICVHGAFEGHPWLVREMRTTQALDVKQMASEMVSGGRSSV